MNNIAMIFKALSNNTRLKIMALLSQNELCVCQIESILKISQVMASRHLTILKHAGLVKNRRKGLWIYYSIIIPKDDIAKKVFGCFNELIRKYPELRVNLKTINSCVEKNNKK